MSRFNGSASAALTQANSDMVVTCPSLSIATSIANANAGANSEADSEAVITDATAIYAYRFAHLQKECDPAEVLLHVVPDGFDDWASHV